MEIKPSLLYILAFFSLVFLLHELSDWSHTMLAGAFCHCWAPRAFDSWNFCPNCVLNDRLKLLVFLPGPLITFIAIWKGRNLMHPDNPIEKRSIGFSLLFAALPLTRIGEALIGKGDTTTVLRHLFQTSHLHHHRLVAFAGLLLVVALCLPALIRAFLLLPSGRGKLLVFPAFLLLPAAIDHWVVHQGLNALMDKGFLNHEVITGLHFLVIAWLFFILAVFLLTSRSLAFLLEYNEQRML